MTRPALQVWPPSAVEEDMAGPRYAIECRYAVGVAFRDRVRVRAGVGVGGRGDEPVPDRVCPAVAGRVGGDGLLVVEDGVRGVFLGRHRGVPVVTAVGGLAEQDGAGPAEAGSVRVEGVADGVDGAAVRVEI